VRSSQRLAKDTFYALAAPCSPGQWSARGTWLGDREHGPRERVRLAGLNALMDQLHGAHVNGRAATAPAQTSDLTKHRAAQINDRKNTTATIGEQGVRRTRGPVGVETILGCANNQVRVRFCRREQE
jgi:hypothetical protein